MKLIVLSLLVATAIAATSAAAVNDTQRAFLLGNWLGNIFGKNKNATNRGFFGGWLDDGPWFGGDDDDDDFFGNDPFGDDDFFNDDDDVIIQLPPTWPGKVPGPPGKPESSNNNATQGVPQGNATTFNATRAWLIGNWLNQAFGKNKTTRGLLGDLLGNVFGKKKNATTRGFGWWNIAFGGDEDPVFSRPQESESKPQKNNATTRGLLGDFLGSKFGKKKNATQINRGKLLNNLWDTLFPQDDFPVEVPIYRPRPAKRPHATPAA